MVSLSSSRFLYKASVRTRKILFSEVIPPAKIFRLFCSMESVTWCIERFRAISFSSSTSTNIFLSLPPDISIFATP
ncbi:MAG: hypothetical protein ACD_79C00782G0002 [uncultured bacterium]|nr:MAG: hypothetical protein ACD_79C00782G0002 [uncultured bacterium]